MRSSSGACRTIARKAVRASPSMSASPSTNARAKPTSFGQYRMRRTASGVRSTMAGGRPHRAQTAPVPEPDLDGEILAEDGMEQGSEGGRGAASVGALVDRVGGGRARFERTWRHGPSLAR